MVSLYGLSQSYFMTVSQSVCLDIEYSCGTCEQISFPVGICDLVSVGRPLWREDGSAICSVITRWSQLLSTRNHVLLSLLRLPQPGGPGSLLYIPQEEGGPVILLGTRLVQTCKYISIYMCVCVCVCVCARARARGKFIYIYTYINFRHARTHTQSLAFC
jgi:hypothetical protein